MNPSGKFAFQGEKNKMKQHNFLTPEEVATEMANLVKHYGTNLSNANLDETRKILANVSLSDELSEMREENR